MIYNKHHMIEHHVPATLAELLEQIGRYETSWLTLSR